MSDDDLALLLFIATYNAQHGYPPSLREIARTRGLTPSAAYWRTTRLIREGHLSQKANTRRSLVVAAPSVTPEREQ